MTQLPKKRLAARLGLSLDQLNEAIKLFEQQLWCWGEDVKHPQGNLLVKCGFDRQPPPKGQEKFGSLYTRRIGRGGQVVLRGWGLLISDRTHGALCLMRYEFLPRLLPCDDIPSGLWDSHSLPKHFVPESDADLSRALFLLAAVCRWIASYERWLSRALVSRYREETIEHWKKLKKTTFARERTLRLWRQLAQRLQAAAERLERSTLPNAA